MTKERIHLKRQHINHELFNKKEEINALKKELAILNNLNHIHNLLESRFKHFSFKTLKGLPHPNTLLNNIESSFLVVEKILLNQKIVIVGDYDADGICATCVMLDFFENIGYANIAYAMPNRFKHGYGFSPMLFSEIMREHPNTSLIITVDNGVSSFEAGALCMQHNIDLIITDHHTLESTNGIEKIPPCNFLINPQQSQDNFEYPDICGSLVAWYLCCATKITLQNVAKDSNIFLEYLEDSKRDLQNLDSKSIHKIARKFSKNLAHLKMEDFLLLVGIAIISDVMPLNAINHTICKYALKNLHKSRKIAIQALLSHLSHKIDSQTLGFKLIPLLNAAGRIEDGKIALNFLRAQNEEQAQNYFKELKNLNDKRRALQDDVTYKAFDSLTRFKQSEHIIFAVGDGWHEGVLGIVAGKMTSDFKKPCFVMTHTNGICKGSARSFGDIDLISSMQNLAHLTNRHGGHMGAVGLEIPYNNIQAFIDSFKPIFCKMERKSHILGILHPNVISNELLATIDIFEPYGNGNPVPKFFLELEILCYKRTTKGFLEFALKFDNRVIKAMFFNSQYANFTFNNGDLLQFSATPSFDSQNYNKGEIMLIIDKIYGLLRFEA